MAEWKKSLESMLGTKGFETLSKAIHRRDSDSTIGPLDVYLPLLVVPRAILSWLVQNIKPIPVGESETLNFPGMEDIKIKVEKIGRDSYRGEFIQDGKVIHSFDKQTLPNVGGNLMTIGEMYETDKEESSDNTSPDIASPDMAMPRIMHQMMAPQHDQSQFNNMTIEFMTRIVGIVGKLTDALIANNLVEKRVEKAIKSAKSEIPEEREEEKVKPYNEPEVRRIKKTGFQEGPSGQAGPTKPDGFQEPIKPNRMQQPKTMNSYFRKRLNRSKAVAKKEHEYHVSETELYTNCPHCGVPEFKKTEAGPKYKPCACFYVTLKSEEGKATSFVRVTRKSEGGYTLSFNEKADPESVETFLRTLKDKLLEHKDNLS